MNDIYMIQVRVSGNRHEPEKFREKRNIGWFDTLKNAEEALKANPAIFSDDGYYKVALIEKVPMGAYSIGMSSEDALVKWYKLEGDTSFENFNAKYVEAPEFNDDGTIGYTVG